MINASSPTEPNQAHKDERYESKPGSRWIATSNLLQFIILVVLHILVVVLQYWLTRLIRHSVSRHFWKSLHDRTNITKIDKKIKLSLKIKFVFVVYYCSYCSFHCCYKFEKTVKRFHAMKKKLLQKKRSTSSTLVIIMRNDNA